MHAAACPGRSDNSLLGSTPGLHHVGPGVSFRLSGLAGKALPTEPSPRPKNKL